MPGPEVGDCGNQLCAPAGNKNVLVVGQVA